MGRAVRVGVPIGVAAAALMAVLLSASCGLDVAGTADDLDATPDGFDDASAEAGDEVSSDVGDACVPEAGNACNSPALCFTGTVECDGRCNAPPDPPAFGAACTTPKGCTGKYDCDGACIGEPIATGGACTTPNGCPGKKTCDETCVGDPPNFGKACATPKGCTSKYDCASKCPENTLVDKACKTINGCDRKTDCTGKCNEDPSYGKACTTAKGCSKTLGCDLKCPADDPKVGTACTVGSCTNGVYDCTLTCKLPAGAGAPCVSATCGISTTKDCFGVCPDPKPGMTTVVCLSCNCPGGHKDIFYDACGNCATCESFSCGAIDGGSVPDAPSDG